LTYKSAKNMKISVPRYHVTHKIAENIKISALKRLIKRKYFNLLRFTVKIC